HILGRRKLRKDGLVLAAEHEQISIRKKGAKGGVRLLGQPFLRDVENGASHIPFRKQRAKAGCIGGCRAVGDDKRLHQKTSDFTISSSSQIRFSFASANMPCSRPGVIGASSPTP